MREGNLVRGRGKEGDRLEEGDGKGIRCSVREGGRGWGRMTEGEGG